jgi:hypothetical protein
MTGNPPEVELSPAIQATLGALRGRIRRYVWLRGLGVTTAVLGAAFWLSLATDWFFEPAPAVRGVLLALAVVATIGILWLLVLRRLAVPITHSNLAMLLERRFPQFGDSLLTTVDLAGTGRAAEECNPDLLAATCRQAEAPIGLVQLRQVFNPGPLRQSLLAAAIFLVTIAGFAATSPGLAAVWARRVLFLSDELWPRDCRLVVEGFDGGVARVARGADLELVAKADLNMPVVPDVVEVRYRGEGGLRKAMTRVGNAQPDRDEFQEYSYTFRGVLTPITFDLVGGDAAIRGLKIDVVDNPTIVEMSLDCEYPKYMDRPPRSLPVAGLMQIPVGTRIAVQARSNKDLVRVTVESASDEPPNVGRIGNPSYAQVTKPQHVTPLAEDPRRFTYRIERFTRDTTLLFTLADADGIKSREPVRLALSALEDRRPEVSVQLRGIGSAVTPQATIPAAGRVEDDYGIARVWFDYAIDKVDPKLQPIASPPGNATQHNVAAVLDVRALALKPGQKLGLCVKAEDRFDLTARPNVGTSDRWLLDVVTPEQLRTMLQSRELVLRQRFESLIKDVTDARDSLSRVDLAPTVAKSAAKPTAPEAKGAEPGDKSDAEADRSPERLAAQRLLQVQWAQQNGRKSAYETAGLAEAFAQIREELINNRIDTEELKLRLEDGISKPLKRVADEMFPELDRRLDRLQLSMAEPGAGREDLASSLQQVDAILLVMRQVLGRMIELEDFNEAVELLKTILQSERALREETKRRHRERLRELME